MFLYKHISSASWAFHIQRIGFLSVSCASPTVGTLLISGITWREKKEF
jgi:hypothetical protein